MWEGVIAVTEVNDQMGKHGRGCGGRGGAGGCARVLAPMVKPSWVQCESVQGSGFGVWRRDPDKHRMKPCPNPFTSVSLEHCTCEGSARCHHDNRSRSCMLCDAHGRQKNCVAEAGSNEERLYGAEGGIVCSIGSGL